MPRDLIAESALEALESPVVAEAKCGDVISYLEEIETVDGKTFPVHIHLMRWYTPFLSLLEHRRPKGPRFDNKLYKGFVERLPVVPDLDKKVARIVVNEPKRLNMGRWHSPCGTVRCIAGWAVHIAEVPRAEQIAYLTDYGLLGMGLFDAAGLALPNFYSGDDEALYYLRRILEG